MMKKANRVASSHVDKQNIALKSDVSQNEPPKKLILSDGSQIWQDVFP